MAINNLPRTNIKKWLICSALALATHGLGAALIPHNWANNKSIKSPRDPISITLVPEKRTPNPSLPRKNLPVIREDLPSILNPEGAAARQIRSELSRSESLATT